MSRSLRPLAALLLFTLTACGGLSASLLNGSGTTTYTPNYEANGQQHSMRITFTLESGTVTGLSIEPEAASGTERAKQLAFSANVRRYVLQKTPDEILLALPESVGAESQLTAVFRTVVQELQADM